MKHVYSSITIAALVGAGWLWFAHGYTFDVILTLIFSAVCAVAAEVRETADSKNQK